MWAYRCVSDQEGVQPAANATHPDGSEATDPPERLEESDLGSGTQTLECRRRARIQLPRCEMDTVAASGVLRWKSERKGGGMLASCSSGKEDLLPNAKRGSLKAAEEMARRGMRKARSFENLEGMRKSFLHLQSMKESLDHLKWMLAEEDEEAWKEALRRMVFQGKEALVASAGGEEEGEALEPPVGEGEALAQKELAEKTIDHDEPCFTLGGHVPDIEGTREKIESTAKSSKSEELRRGVEEENELKKHPSAKEELKSKALSGRVEEENEPAPYVEEEHALAKEGPPNKKIDYHDPFTILGVEIVDILGMRGENEGTALWRVKKAELAEEATMERLKVEFGCGNERKVEDPKEEEDIEMKRSDYEACVASQFHDDWIALYSAYFGSFEDTTRLGPMRFTDQPAPCYTAFPIGTLQVFSVKVAGTRRGLQWPLDVFGFIAVRDSIDKNRNMIFNRARNSCQTLTEKDRYLVLTGPTRAVVWPSHVTIEVKLTMKGATESEDKDLSFLAVPLRGSDDASYSYMFHRYKTSKLSTLKFTLGHIVESVEATIFVRVIDGSWPDSCCGQFAAFSTGIHDKDFRTIDHQKMILLDSRGKKVLVTGDGEIELFRRVVSVETSGTLKVSVKSWEAARVKKNVVEDEWVFTPQEAKRSYGRLDTGFCSMEVTVAWSLISHDPVTLNVY